jgi:hypothetical protein
VSGKIYQIKSQCNTSLVIGVNSGSIHQGAALNMVPVNSDDQSQLWLATQNQAGTMQFQAMHSNFNMDVYGASANPGAALIQWKSNQQPNQSFAIQADGIGGFALVAAHSQLALTGDSGALTVAQQNTTGDCSQSFTFTPVTSAAGLCLSNSSIAASVNLFSQVNATLNASGNGAELAYFSSSLQTYSGMNSARHNPNSVFDVYVDSQMNNFTVTVYKNFVGLIKTNSLGVPDASFGQGGFVDLSSYFQNVHNIRALALNGLANGQLLVSSYGIYQDGTGLDPVAQVNLTNGAVQASSLATSVQRYCRTAASVWYLSWSSD